MGCYCAGSSLVCCASSPANVPGKIVDDGPITWVPVTHVEDLDRVLGSWLLPNLVLAVMGICGGVNQWTEALFIKYIINTSSFQKKKKKGTWGQHHGTAS